MATLFPCISKEYFFLMLKCCEISMCSTHYNTYAGHIIPLPCTVIFDVCNNIYPSLNELYIHWSIFQEIRFVDIKICSKLMFDD